MSNRLISLRNYYVNQAGLIARNVGAIGGATPIDNEEIEFLKFRLTELEVNKANQSDLALKANQSDLALKANQSDLALKANQSDLQQKVDKNETDSISDRVKVLEEQGNQDITDKVIETIKTNQEVDTTITEKVNDIIGNGIDNKVVEAVNNNQTINDTQNLVYQILFQSNNEQFEIIENNVLNSRYGAPPVLTLSDNISVHGSYILTIIKPGNDDFFVQFFNSNSITNKLTLNNKEDLKDNQLTTSASISQISSQTSITLTLNQKTLTLNSVTNTQLNKFSYPNTIELQTIDHISFDLIIKLNDIKVLLIINNTKNNNNSIQDIINKIVNDIEIANNVNSTTIGGDNPTDKTAFVLNNSYYLSNE